MDKRGCDTLNTGLLVWQYAFNLYMIATAFDNFLDLYYVVDMSFPC